MGEVQLTKALGFTVAIALGVAGIGAACDPLPQTTGGTEADWGDYFTARSLVADSDLIVVAELRRETPDEVVFPSATNPDVKFVRSDLVQQFDIVEVIKGTYEYTSLERRLTVGHDFPGSTRRDAQSLEIVELEIGRQYVLFLTNWAVDDKRVAWGAPGQPGIAEIEGDRLIFRGTERYGDAVEARGMAKASARSEAPFEMTLTELRAK